MTSPPGLRRVRSFGPDGSVVLEDGSEMQAYVNPAGVLGVRPKTREDVTSHLDQYAGPPRAEPAGPPPNYFDISGLDQT